jgi:hypothetical protein
MSRQKNTKDCSREAKQKADKRKQFMSKLPEERVTIKVNSAFSPMLLPPLPRWYELATPQTRTPTFSFGLRVQVVRRVLALI